VYNNSGITIIVLDNGTTAMTGHQEHPGTGISAKGKQAGKVDLERLVRGTGVDDVKVVNAFNIKALRTAVKSSLENPELSVLIVRGPCSVRLRKRTSIRAIDKEKCDACETCLKIGCPAIQKLDGETCIDVSLCAGDACTICEQLCPKGAIAGLPASRAREPRK
jgi:indolepyruvate ferredoxin oxidoreductase alpha subunit